MHIRTSIGGRRESLWECVITLTYVLWYEKAIVLKRGSFCFVLFFCPDLASEVTGVNMSSAFRLVLRLYNMGSGQ